MQNVLGPASLPRAGMRRSLAVLIVLALVAPPGAARQIEASDAVHVTALAVAETPQGLVGLAAEVQATALADGTGQVFVDTKPLAQTDMQGSARQAAQAAASLLGEDAADYDFLVVFRSDSPVIGGPSAGAVMTLALATALWNLLHPDDPWRLDAGVAATGMINPDGTVGPVGGVPAKAEGAAEAGLHTFLYPAGLEQAPLRTPQGVVTVDMAAHCEGLGITCRPVATVEELVRIAAGVSLQRPDVPVPGTEDYGALLGPRVRPDVARLEARIDAASGTLEASGLAGEMRTTVVQDLETARSRLEAAEAALGDERYYTAATMAFQGNIHVGAAENRTAFYLGDRAAGPVEAALQACQEAIDAAAAGIDGLDARDMHGLYALGAAERRLEEARDLARQAVEAYQAAFAREQWTQALFAASFCTERAGTVSWWADLRDVFGAAPPIGDLDALVRDSLERAADMVLYANEVLGGFGTEPAQALLEAARLHVENGEAAAAVLAAAEAEVSASVTMMTAAGSVPDEVLDAARTSASQAIARARAAGTEPLLSVAQVELAQDLQEPGASLSNLWSARNLALLAVQGPPVAPEPHIDTGLPEPVVVSLLVGFLVGAASVAVAAVVAVVVAAGRR